MRRAPVASPRLGLASALLILACLSALQKLSLTARLQPVSDRGVESSDENWPRGELVCKEIRFRGFGSGHDLTDVGRNQGMRRSPRQLCPTRPEINSFSPQGHLLKADSQCRQFIRVSGFKLWDSSMCSQPAHRQPPHQGLPDQCAYGREHASVPVCTHTHTLATCLHAHIHPCECMNAHALL